MSDAKVRQAISFTFDRDSLCATFSTASVPGRLPLPGAATGPSTPRCDPYAEIRSSTKPRSSCGCGHPGGQGLEGLEILSPLGFAELEAAAVLLQANLAALGINAAVTELELAAWVDRLVTKPDFVMTTDSYGYGDSRPPPPSSLATTSIRTPTSTGSRPPSTPSWCEGASTVDRGASARRSTLRNTSSS